MDSRYEFRIDAELKRVALDRFGSSGLAGLLREHVRTLLGGEVVEKKEEIRDTRREVLDATPKDAGEPTRPKYVSYKPSGQHANKVTTHFANKTTTASANKSTTASAYDFQPAVMEKFIRENEK